MEIPSWFRHAIRRRIDIVAAEIERHPDLREHRAAGAAAFAAMFADKDQSQGPAHMEWEDKHHFTRAWENERLYLQGLRDGMQLIATLLSDPRNDLATPDDPFHTDDSAASAENTARTAPLYSAPPEKEGER